MQNSDMSAMQQVRELLMFYIMGHPMASLVENRERRTSHLQAIRNALEQGAEIQPNALRDCMVRQHCRGEAEPDERVALAKVLLEWGASPSAEVEGSTALHSAASSGFFECVNFLVEKGAAVNSTDSQARTPLHMTVHDKAEPSAVSIAEYLVASGANIDACHSTLSPLMLAAQCSDVQMAEFLIEKGADAGMANLRGETAMSIASEAAARHHSPSAARVDSLLNPRRSCLIM